MHNTTDIDLVGDVKKYAASVLLGLQGHIARSSDDFSLSDDTTSEIKNRVSPNNTKHFQDIVNVVYLYCWEIEEIGRRISYYRYITQYKDHFSAEEFDMFIAFQTHVHALRGSEIYVIMEKCICNLRFAYFLCSDLGLRTDDRFKKIKSKFRKQFKRHLDERHRIVHSHERPSLQSGMLKLFEVGADKDTLTDVLSDVVVKMVKGFSQKYGNKLKGGDYSGFINSLVDLQSTQVENECRQMWEIYSAEIARTIDNGFLVGPMKKL